MKKLNLSSISEMLMKIYEKIAKIQFFPVFWSVRLRGPSNQKERKKCFKNEVLDVEKFDDTAENEAFEVP